LLVLPSFFFAHPLCLGINITQKNFIYRVGNVGATGQKYDFPSGGKMWDLPLSNNNRLKSLLIFG
jgi:hypothetical protein